MTTERPTKFRHGVAVNQDGPPVVVSPPIVTSSEPKSNPFIFPFLIGIAAIALIFAVVGFSGHHSVPAAPSVPTCAQSVAAWNGALYGPDSNRTT